MLRSLVRRRFAAALPLALALAACSEEASQPLPAEAGASGAAGAQTDGGAQSDGGDARADGAAGWGPGTIFPVDPAGPRGLTHVRGIIHAHSVYSHDACDNHPRDDAGGIDTECFDDLRRSMCAAKHEFVMLTDHRGTFAETEFPEVLQYRPERGDKLVERGGTATANWVACPGGAKPVLVLAGCEAGTMPVGLEGHVSADAGERSKIYGEATDAAVGALKAKGAVALVAHTEDWTVDELATLPLDGFEMYNVHANMFRSAGTAIEMLTRLRNGDNDLPHPDLFILPIVTEDPRYVDVWGSVLARAVKRVTVMATDSHRNSFPQLLADGERIDSYRRMMIWFSNHLLVRAAGDGTWTDAELKEALRAGRLYGAYEYLGYPIGFDFHALEAGQPREMGEQVSLAKGVDLVAAMPKVQDLDPGVQPPAITARLLRARDGGWDVVATAPQSLQQHLDTAGVYRVEIRMVPLHLAAFLGRDADKLSKSERVWIYSNPIYVGP
jgi:hypothetical protein